METLTLKNKNIQNNPTPPKLGPEFDFRPLQIKESGVRAIGISQGMFETFWKQLRKIDATRMEKEECLKKLKEACYWIGRGIANYNEIKIENKDTD